MRMRTNSLTFLLTLMTNIYCSRLQLISFLCIMKDLDVFTLVKKSCNIFYFHCIFSFIDHAIEAIDEFAFLEGNIIFFKRNKLFTDVKLNLNVTMWYIDLFTKLICVYLFFFCRDSRLNILSGTDKTGCQQPRTQFVSKTFLSHFVKFLKAFLQCSILILYFTDLNRKL